MKKNLATMDIVSNGISIGVKNAASLIGAVVLWVLTIWIPYLNVGTTIAIASLPLEMAKGKVFSPTAIFDKKYRSLMGEFFLLAIFLYSGMLIGMLFFFVPGIIIAISWSLAILIMIDKKLNPIEALTASNLATLGNKWSIFFAMLIIGIGVTILYLICAAIMSKVYFLGALLIFIVMILYAAVGIGMQAYIYKTLCGSDKEEA